MRNSGEDLFKGPLHEKYVGKLETLTQPSYWDYERFRSILICLAQMGEGQAIPARNRPDRIDVGGWERHIRKLVDMTEETGKEHARALLVDIERGNLLVSGYITRGTEWATRLDTSKQPGRELLQRCVASIHVHPSDILSHGLSREDYKIFLSNPEQQAMLLAYGDFRLLALKTSVTPKDSIERRVTDVHRDYLENSGNQYLGLVNFNKAICSEFGLVMYTSDQRNGSSYHRVNVTT